jgi:murein DD-endopeptidase MepM/ murein hydrolase activator NlpD
MIGPADLPLEYRQTPADEACVASASSQQPVSRKGLRRRLNRRGALALLLGTAAVLTLKGQAVHAQDASSIEGTAALPPTEGSNAASDTPDSDVPADAAPAEATAPVVAKTYVVQAHDTLYSIAKRHGVSVDAVLWANDLTDANVVKQGQKLIIPPSTGKLHTVKDGDTVESLSQSYSVSMTGIAAVNGVAEDATLRPGQRLLIPVAIKPSSGEAPTFAPVTVSAASAEEPVSIPANGGTGSPTPPLVSTVSPLTQVPGMMTATGAPSVTVTNRKVPKLAWPLQINSPKSGVSQNFRPGHTGIDIYAPEGTQIKAAAPGTVKMAEKYPDGFSGYGWIVILDHGDGITTWYAHCGSFEVKEGEKVKGGDVIGAVGMTGRTTGPHLHFELRVASSAVDPKLALS